MPRGRELMVEEMVDNRVVNSWMSSGSFEWIRWVRECLAILITRSAVPFRKCDEAGENFQTDPCLVRLSATSPQSGSFEALTIWLPLSV